MKATVRWKFEDRLGYEIIDVRHSDSLEYIEKTVALQVMAEKGIKARPVIIEIQVKNFN